MWKSFNYTYYYVFIRIIFVIQIKSEKHNKMKALNTVNFGFKFEVLTTEYKQGAFHWAYCVI